MSLANRIGLRVAVAAVASGAMAAGGLAVAASAGAGTTAAVSHRTAAYSFRTVDNARDLTFNQLLGINDHGIIAGYFGSGAEGHPNKGYLLFPRHGQHYRNENFPGSVQTQVTGLNNTGVTVGFWSDMNNASQVNDNFGFYSLDGRHFRTVSFPGSGNTSLPVNQLLGVNDHRIAAGFYTDAQGNNHGYTYSIRRNSFTRVTVPGDAGLSLTAAGINDEGDVTGFYTGANGMTHGFLKERGGRFTTLSVPGATATQALGVNEHDEVVGVYAVGSGNGMTMHGFTWRPGRGFSTVDDPHGVGTTTINGVNDRGDLVGFYTDSAGNTDGFLATSS